MKKALVEVQIPQRKFDWLILIGKKYYLRMMPTPWVYKKQIFKL
jgi:hypothetical protein